MRDGNGFSRHAALALSGAALFALLGSPAAASASPGSGPPAIVSMGDSYSSGQGGRWQGNSNVLTAGNAGTDRACVGTGLGCRYEIGKVYLGGTRPPGCARSDVAEIRSARIAGNQPINIACSGAVTGVIFRSSRGGRGYKGEAPQADQLARIARRSDVTLIVLSIGGNDIGFGDLVVACVSAYLTRAGPCAATRQPALEARLPRMRAGVTKALAEIRAVMREAGYRPWDYRLVLQGYPSAVPRAAENRYPQMSLERGANCPLYDTDLNYARDTLVPRLDSELRAVAEASGAQFLSLPDVLQGHEMCSRSARLADAAHPPSAATSEWARFISANAILQGQTIDEQVHPNAFGQRAIGRCLTLLFTRTTGGWTCRHIPGEGTDGMSLTRVSALPARFPLRLRVSPRRVRAGKRRCFNFRTLSGAEPVERVTILFAGRRTRTSRTGRARKCVRLKARNYRVRARRAGFRPTSVIVRAARRGARAGR